MLSACAVLREEHRPSVRVGIDDRDSTTATKADRAPGTESGDRLGDSLDDSTLALVQRDVEAVCPRCTADIAVAQVHPEQVTVRRELRSPKVGGRLEGRGW